MPKTRAVMISKAITAAYSQYNVSVRVTPCKSLGEGEFIFEVQPLAGTKVRSITDLAEDVNICLHFPVFLVFKEDTHVYIRVCTSDIRHNKLIPLLRNIKPRIPNPQLKFALGYDMMGNGVYDYLNRMPHLLIAGATNSGKSVALKSLILSLAYKLPAQYVNMVIVDVEGKSLSLFEGLPHLSYPVVHDKDECIYVIDEVHREMTRRLELDNAEINMLPYLVCIIDEFAHVSEQCNWAINNTVSDILRLGRKVKLHMVLATQSATKRSLSIEDNNITARIAFQCADFRESIAAINKAGAENLIGDGDMLYSPYNSGKLEHLQGAYIFDNDIIEMVNDIKGERHILDRKFTIPEMDPLLRSVMKDEPEFVSSTDKHPDQELAKIILWILGRNDVSVSGLKDKFRMGNRANTIMNKLYEFGIVSEKNANFPRTVVPKTIDDLSEDVKRLLNNSNITDEELVSVFNGRNT